jgi:hypothetical protein
LAWYLESSPKSLAGSPKIRKWGEDGEDRVTLSKIQLFDNWGAVLDRRGIILMSCEKIEFNSIGWNY